MQSGDDRFADERDVLLEEIDAEVQETAQLTGVERLSDGVREALAQIPRHAFVPPGEETVAYVNSALPIGCGQTISQPYIVALMTQLVDPQADDTILEIGTGSGYQAAVLATLVERVYSIEVVPELAESAAARLARMGYDNVEVRSGDGAEGWPEHAPFNGIIVTACAPGIPQPLVDQLRPGGRLVIPVGEPGSQMLTVVTKTDEGGVEERGVLPVAFVPLVGNR